MKEKKAPGQVRVTEHRLDAVDANGCPTIVRVHGHERSFYVRAPDAVAALVLKDAFPADMKAQADNKTNDTRDAKNMPMATSTTRIALPPIDTPAELMPIKDHHRVGGGTLVYALASACLVSPFHPASYVIGCSSSPDT
jgi:hypothetical protein